MSTKTMHYLDLISAGKPVNWLIAKRALLNAGIDQSYISAAFEPVAYSDKKYEVKVLCQATIEKIRALLSKNHKKSRSAASITGNTHSTNVDGAMLITWHFDAPTPEVKVFSDALPLIHPDKPHVLIIENEECFLNKEDIYEFAQKYCGLTAPAEQIEFVYGSGNSISNKRIIPYLKLVEGDVFCLFDVDLGGLSIYSNLLSAGLDPTKTHFLIPTDLIERLKYSKRRATNGELEKLESVYGMSAITDQVITALRHYKKTIEQESYRA
ncbi:MAG: hypothetical protein QS721_10430 [Candidatus Endonucleobacter sp. (ex Gigantidas childressi)]|nr:hypothetical protein [Candidatus Endonucleobacter sp. (ex Gigantidas childressi)]